MCYCANKRCSSASSGNVCESTVPEHPSNKVSKEVFVDALKLFTQKQLEEHRHRKATAKRPRRTATIMKYTLNGLCKRPINEPKGQEDFFEESTSYKPNSTPGIPEYSTDCYVCSYSGADRACDSCKTKFHPECLKLTGSNAPRPYYFPLCPKCVQARNSSSHRPEKSDRSSKCALSIMSPSSSNGRIRPKNKAQPSNTLECEDVLRFDTLVNSMNASLQKSTTAANCSTVRRSTAIDSKSKRNNLISNISRRTNSARRKAAAGKSRPKSRATKKTGSHKVASNRVTVYPSREVALPSDHGQVQDLTPRRSPRTLKRSVIKISESFDDVSSVSNNDNISHRALISNTTSKKPDLELSKLPSTKLINIKELLSQRSTRSRARVSQKKSLKKVNNSLPGSARKKGDIASKLQQSTTSRKSSKNGPALIRPEIITISSSSEDEEVESHFPDSDRNELKDLASSVAVNTDEKQNSSQNSDHGSQKHFNSLSADIRNLRRDPIRQRTPSPRPRPSHMSGLSLSPDITDIKGLNRRRRVQMLAANQKITQTSRNLKGRVNTNEEKNVDRSSSQAVCKKPCVDSNLNIHTNDTASVVPKSSDCKASNRNNKRKRTAALSKKRRKKSNLSNNDNSNFCNEPSEPGFSGRTRVIVLPNATSSVTASSSNKSQNLSTNKPPSSNVKDSCISVRMSSLAEHVISSPSKFSNESASSYCVKNTETGSAKLIRPSRLTRIMKEKSAFASNLISAQSTKKLPGSSTKSSKLNSQPESGSVQYECPVLAGTVNGHGLGNNRINMPSLENPQTQEIFGSKVGSVFQGISSGLGANLNGMSHYNGTRNVSKKQGAGRKVLYNGSPITIVISNDDDRSPVKSSQADNLSNVANNAKVENLSTVAQDNLLEGEDIESIEKAGSTHSSCLASLGTDASAQDLSDSEDDEILDIPDYVPSREDRLAAEAERVTMEVFLW